MANVPAHEARNSREREAARYQPGRIDLLLIAEAPPTALDRYFYFADVTEQDSLFRYVCRGVLGQQPSREAKTNLLAALQDRDVFLIDLQQEPVDGTPLRNFVPDLVTRCKALNPRKIILIKTTVFDAAYIPLRDAGLPVSSVRIPFPGSGRQREFEVAFARALNETVP